MTSRVQKIMFWDTFKKAKSVILHFFPVAEIGRNIHLLYFSYPQQIYSQFVKWGKKVLSPHSPQWCVHFPVLLLLITRKHPVQGLQWTEPENFHLCSNWVIIVMTDTAPSGLQLGAMACLNPDKGSGWWVMAASWLCHMSHVNNCTSAICW